MRDTELYRHLLGLEAPWSVSRVELNVKEQRIDVWVEHARGLVWRCPECDVEAPLHDHGEERTWRHLDSCQFLTYLHARPPRVRCREHGVRQVHLPWADPHARFTRLFERLAIDVLLQTDVLGAARILRVSWDEAWHLQERAVERGLAAKPRQAVAYVGIDEKATARGQTYATLVCDIERGTVEEVLEGRRKESLDRYWLSLTPEQRGGIRGVAMDMWEPYVQSVLEHVPNGQEKIVFDRFHIMMHLGEAVDTVRKQEHRALEGGGDKTLSGTKYLWLYATENLPQRHRERFKQLMAENLKTGRAWALKEALRMLWTYARLGWARRFWKWWYFWATHSRLKPIIQKARMVQRHLANVLTYFTHRITNAVAEGLNSKIQTIKKMAYGFRNQGHFKTAILFHCGGLDLYPPTH